VSKRKKTGLTHFGKEIRRMTRQIVLKVSPVLYGRMELRARQQHYDMHEWVLRAVIGELLQLQNEEARRAQEALAAPSALPFALWPVSATERNPHASHS